MRDRSVVLPEPGGRASFNGDGDDRGGGAYRLHLGGANAGPHEWSS